MNCLGLSSLKKKEKEKEKMEEMMSMGELVDTSTPGDETGDDWEGQEAFQDLMILGKGLPANHPELAPSDDGYDDDGDDEGRGEMTGGGIVFKDELIGRTGEEEDEEEEEGKTKFKIRRPRKSIETDQRLLGTIKKANDENDDDLDDLDEYWDATDEEQAELDTKHEILTEENEEEANDEKIIQDEEHAKIIEEPTLSALRLLKRRQKLLQSKQSASTRRKRDSSLNVTTRITEKEESKDNPRDEMPPSNTSWKAQMRRGQIPVIKQQQKKQNRVIVSARVRPLLGGEAAVHINQRKAVIADAKNQTVTVWLPPSSRLSQTPEKAKRKNFYFDNVFEETNSQAEVYQQVAAPLVDSIMNGINGCLIAYGQTGAGKTFTTFGPVAEQTASRFSLDETYESSEYRTTQLGLIPRAVHAMFDRLQTKVNENRNKIRQMKLAAGSTLSSTSSSSMNSIPRYSYAVYVSFYQIYLDSHIQDLVHPEKNQLNIRMVEGRDGDSTPSHQVSGLSIHRVTSVSQVLELLEKGDQNRVVSQTSMNVSSSRSHSIFTVQLVQQETGSPGSSIGARTIRAKLTCVDLAGSERASRTHPTGLQLEEAKSINKSLSALGNVIAALSNGKTANSNSNSNSNSTAASVSSAQSVNGSESGDNSSEQGFVPWRDSKLTRVLRDSLGGNANVSLIINVGPGADNVKESINSLLFGRRSMQVSLQPKVNIRTNYLELAKQLQEALDQAHESYQVQIAELEDKLLVKISEIESLKLGMHGDNQVLAQLYSKIDNAEKSLSNERVKNAKLQETHDLLEDALLEQLDINTKMEKKLRQVHDEKVQQPLLASDDAQVATDSKHRELVHKLREQVRRAQEGKEAAEQKSDELQIQLDELDAESSERIVDLQARIQAYERQLMADSERRTAELVLLERNSEQMTKLQDTLDQERRDYNLEKQSFHQKIESYETEISKLKAKKTKLKTVENESVSHLKEELTKSRGKVKQQKALLEQSKSRCEALSTGLNVANKRAEELVSQLDSERKVIAQLKQTISEKDDAYKQSFEEFKSEIKAIEEKLSQKEKYLGAVDEKLKEKDSEIKAQKLQQVELQSHLDTSKNNLTYLQDSLNRTESLLAEKSDQVTSLESDNAILKDRLVASTDRLEAAEEKLDSIILMQEQERQLYEAMLSSSGVKVPDMPSSRNVFHPPTSPSSSSLSEGFVLPKTSRSKRRSSLSKLQQQSVHSVSSVPGRLDMLSIGSTSPRHSLRGRIESASATSPFSGDQDLLSSPRLQRALNRSKQALARAMEAINDV